MMSGRRCRCAQVVVLSVSEVSALGRFAPQVLGLGGGRGRGSGRGGMAPGGQSQGAASPARTAALGGPLFRVLRVAAIHDPFYLPIYLCIFYFFVFCPKLAPIFT